MDIARCFLSKIKIYKCKNVSISCFSLKTRNGNIVQVFGYDEIADFLYSNLNINDDVFIEGYLNSFKNDIFVNIVNINKINKNKK